MTIQYATAVICKSYGRTIYTTIKTNKIKIMNTQKKQVENYLKAKGKITSWDAITFFRITRLSHYILTLRKEGWNIDSVWKSNAKKRWTEYVYKDFVSWK